MYDETGSLEDSEDLSSEAYTSLYDYYRTVYPKVWRATYSPGVPECLLTQQH